MLVEELMNRNMITLPPNATINEALQLLEKHKIRHITIVDESMQVLGIVSDRDVRDASPSTFLDTSDFHILSKEIQTIMTSPVITIHPMDFVEEIAYIFYDKEIACLPVVSQNKLVGVVTEKDMLYKLIQLTGTHEQSSLIEVKVPDQPGELPRVASVFGNHNVNIVSVLLYPYKDPDYKVLVFRVKTLNPMPIINDLRDAGYTLLWPNNIMEPKK
ncbi:acetoin utilization AcuB family protein [Oceanobacillus oncorhynchi subsp. oncorhynchi]|uniref:acetoin utilization AcuB family protein n=1 Tax=Oceanobacillus TaxID=182709 RepID=UPI0030DB8991